MAIMQKCSSADLVLVGSFGCHPYMNPDWIVDNLFTRSSGQPAKVDIQLDGLSLEPSFLVNANGYIIDISRRRLVIRHEPFSVEAFDEMERIAHVLSELLPHTACTAMGVNFRFTDCHLPEGGRLIRPIEALTIKEDACPRSLMASYPQNDFDTLNVTIVEPLGDNPRYEILFNFDTKINGKDTPPLVAVKNKLIERPISECYKASLSVLGDAE